MLHKCRKHLFSIEIKVVTVKSMFLPPVDITLACARTHTHTVPQLRLKDSDNAYLCLREGISFLDFLSVLYFILSFFVINYLFVWYPGT